MKPKVPRKLKKELKKITVQRQYTFEPNDTGFRGFVVKGKINKRTKKVLAKLYYQERSIRRTLLTLQNRKEHVVKCKYRL